MNVCSNNFAPAAVSLNYNCPTVRNFGCGCEGVSGTEEFTNQIPEVGYAFSGCAGRCGNSGCGCCADTAAANAGGCACSAFAPAFLSAFTAEPRFHVRGCPVVFDRLDTTPQRIAINCEGTVFTVAQTGMYRVFYTAQTNLTSETIFRISVNGNPAAGTVINACAGAPLVCAEAIIPLNGGDRLTLNVLSDNTALLRSAGLTLLRVA